MKKRFILKKNEQIAELVKNKTSVGSSYITIYYRKNHDYKNFKYAISVGKKVGKAVTRNYIKRQLNSILNNVKNNIGSQYEFLIVTKPKIITMSYQQKENELIKLLLRSHIMEESK